MKAANKSFLRGREIEAILNQCLTRDEEQDVCFYIDGWNDEKVAKEVDANGTDCTVNHVRGIRGALFGNLRQRGPALRSERDDELEETVENLRQVVRGLTQKVESLRKIVEGASTQRFTRMMTAKDIAQRALSDTETRMDDYQKMMANQGFDECCSAEALILAGAKVMKTGQGTFVTLPR